MATYNWAKPIFFNNSGYKAPTGSDTTGDGTANKPYRTIQKCIDAGKTVIQCAPEIIRESWVGNVGLILEPGCVVDQTFTNSGGFSNLEGGKIINTKSLVYFTNYSTFFKGSLPSNVSNNEVRRNIIIKSPSPSTISYYGNNGGEVSNSTFINALINLTVNTSTASLVWPRGFNRCVFVGCDVYSVNNISLNSINIDFNLFHNCRYKFGNDTVFLTQTQLETTYGVTGIDAVKAYHNAKFGSNNVFNYSKVADPLFNVPDYDDYTLQMLSPARHMSYEGTFVGAKDIAFPTYAYANDLGQPAAFYNTSANANTIVANNSISLARNLDGSAVGNGEITEKPRNLGKIYELKTNQSSYVFADRNREMLDARADGNLSAPISAGTALTNGVVYINEGGSVVYNGVTYINRSRITAVDSVQSFTTTEGAVLYAVLEYPNRYTNFIRHKQTIAGTQITAGTNVLTAGSWYRVLTNSITWDGKTVPVGDSFQAVVGKRSFTGAGVVVEEFSEADVYSEVIIDAPVKCRRVGNVSTGAIDAGTDGKPLTNGHAEYYNATNRPRAEFSIFAAYIQKRWILNTKMLK